MTGESARKALKKDNFKGMILDADFLRDLTDMGTRQLSERTMLMCLALLEFQNWKTRWDNLLPDDDIRQWVSLAQSELMTEIEATGSDMKLRQKPSDAYVLQQEQAAGNWVDVFDFDGLFTQEGDTIINVINVNIPEQTNRNTYLRGVDNATATGGVNAQCPTTNFNGDATVNREDALCMALSGWCYNAWLIAADENNRLAQVGLAGAALVIGVSAIVSGGLSVALSGVICSGMAAIVGYIEMSPEAFSDGQAMRDVIQDLYYSLRGVAITQANFYSKIQALNYTPATNHRAVLANVLKELITTTTTGVFRGNYLAFCDGLGRAYAMRLSGFNESVCVTLTDWQSAIDVYLNRGEFSWVSDEIIRLTCSADKYAYTGVSADIGQWACSLALPSELKPGVIVVAAPYLRDMPTPPAGESNIRIWYDLSHSQVDNTETAIINKFKTGTFKFDTVLTVEAYNTPGANVYLKLVL